ncbi:MAG TPA: nuclease-related domain-containing protein [Bacillus sp. (in: firmicutes)]|nr:nuclease-related domain-containing protein [Bacillus sp. (in: firmicutes)]
MLSKILQKFIKKDLAEKPHVFEEEQSKQNKNKINSTRIGELGEYKINIQLDQLPKECRYLSDLLLPNPKAKSGYSQIDHVILTSYGIFVIETKNYAGVIAGDRSKPTWTVNGKFKMVNPFNQNYGHIKAVQSILTSVEEANIISMVSFTKRCTFRVNPELRKIQSNDLIVYDIELSEYITRKLNVLKIQLSAPIFSDEELLHMYNKLQKENITDVKIREKHVELLKANDNEKSSVDGKQLENATCKTCGKEVSKKVREFCLSNQERFKGEIYCFEHQKGGRGNL